MTFFHYCSMQGQLTDDVFCLQDRSTGLDLDRVHEYSAYWEQTRMLYAPFECAVTMKTDRQLGRVRQRNSWWSIHQSSVPGENKRTIFFSFLFIVSYDKNIHPVFRSQSSELLCYGTLYSENQFLMFVVDRLSV